MAAAIRPLKLSNVVFPWNFSGYLTFMDVRYPLLASYLVGLCFLTAAADAYYEILKCYPDVDENCIICKPVDNDSTKKNRVNIVNGSLIQQAL
jgi:hypothetical protein